MPVCCCYKSTTDPNDHGCVTAGGATCPAVPGYTVESSPGFCDSQTTASPKLQAAFNLARIERTGVVVERNLQAKDDGNLLVKICTGSEFKIPKNVVRDSKRVGSVEGNDSFELMRIWFDSTNDEGRLISQLASELISTTEPIIDEELEQPAVSSVASPIASASPVASPSPRPQDEKPLSWSVNGVVGQLYNDNISFDENVSGIKVALAQHNNFSDRGVSGIEASVKLESSRRATVTYKGTGRVGARFQGKVLLSYYPAGD